MEVVQFIADNPASGLRQIQARLGPDAVVLSVRRLPAQGVARLLPGQRRVEILAGVPDRNTAATNAPVSVGRFMAGNRPAGSPGNPWQTVAWLEAMGLFPAIAQRLQSELSRLHPRRLASLDEEWVLVRETLAGLWISPKAPAPVASATHVFVGPPGSGKSTVLCKWLTLEVLTRERTACVWRLDGTVANTADFLSVHCEMLGVPVDRFTPEIPVPADLKFVDVPGVEMDDVRSMVLLREQISKLPAPEVHLVLNAAYDAEVLLAHWKSFSGIGPTDLIFTHLDEEKRRVKLWNLMLEAGCGIRFLSAGQKIPGDFLSATPDLLFPSVNHR
ncbi:MAG: hypothetical protein U1F98_08095 [Verrucomicrobiota bacterium]